MSILPLIAVMMPISEDQRFIGESPSVGSDERNERVHSAAAGVRYAAVAATSRVVIYIDAKLYRRAPFNVVVFRGDPGFEEHLGSGGEGSSVASSYCISRQ